MSEASSYVLHKPTRCTPNFSVPVVIIPEKLGGPVYPPRRVTEPIQAREEFALLTHGDVLL